VSSVGRPLFLLPPAPLPSLLPSTTLFRSVEQQQAGLVHQRTREAELLLHAARQLPGQPAPERAEPRKLVQTVEPGRQLAARHPRSEEHTSELQSRENLVCRLLLEKKKHTH